MYVHLRHLTRSSVSLAGDGVLISTPISSRVVCTRLSSLSSRDPRSGILLVEVANKWLNPLAATQSSFRALESDSCRGQSVRFQICMRSCRRKLRCIRSRFAEIAQTAALVLVLRRSVCACTLTCLSSLYLVTGYVSALGNEGLKAF